MSKPVEYRLAVPGFGTWRIAYEPAKRSWVLAYNVRARGDQWTSVSEHLQAESASQAVADRNTTARLWDGLQFALPAYAELSRWSTDASEGVQADPAE